MILCSRGGKCLKIGAFPQGAEHADAPCVMLHGGREAAPSSTARGRSVRGRLLRRLASTATNTVARLDPPCTDVCTAPLRELGGCSKTRSYVQGHRDVHYMDATFAFLSYLKLPAHGYAKIPFSV